MLRQRVITALVLAPIIIGGLFFLPPLGFAVFTALVLAIAGWEWANIAGIEAQPGRWGYALAILLAMGACYTVPVIPVLGILMVFWVLMAIAVVRYPAMENVWAPVPVRLVMGIAVLAGAWLALNHLRAGDLQLGDASSNLLLILYTFLVVWAADIGAYFAGRALGKRKLAPAVSPGKTLAGVWGGLLVVALLAAGVGLWFELPRMMFFQFLLVSLITAVASIFGDLFESMLKRHRGIKDSSQLLPGHGGLLDRLDSLVIAIPVLASCVTALGWLVPAQ